MLKAKNGHGKGQTVHNPLAIAETSGAVHFLHGLNYATCFHLRSDDDGATWSRPREITASFEAFRAIYPWKDIAIGPGHGIQLRNGRLVAPVWFCDGSSINKHRPSLVSTIFSDDHGATWQCGEIAVPCTGKFINPNETAIVQLPDGRVMLNARNESVPNRRLVVTSRDGATGWSKPRFDQALEEPICMASLIAVSAVKTGQKPCLVFSNPRNLKRDEQGKEIPHSRAPRQNLTLRSSYDNGRTWTRSRCVEPGPSAYSDLAVLPDRTILCFYERTGFLTLARVSLPL